MKHLITLALLIIVALTAVAQNYNCVPYNYNTPWTQLYEIPTDSLQRIANSPMHFHTWEYEDCGDRQEDDDLYGNLTKPPCGYTTLITERRICEVCTMFEERKLTKGFKAVYFTTPFDSLKQRYYKQHNPQSKHEDMWRGSYTTTSDTIIMYTDTIRMSDFKNFYYLPNDHK